MDSYTFKKKWTWQGILHTSRWSVWVSLKLIYSFYYFINWLCWWFNSQNILSLLLAVVFSLLLLLFVVVVCLLFVLCTHRYISGANFFGEIIEWFGFAMASNFSLSSITFLIFTIANLAPRAAQHHDWYLNKFQKNNKNTKFQQYPKDRTALIPFVW